MPRIAPPQILGWVLATLLVAGPLRAHEFWIEPETFAPALGDQVALRLFVGDGLADATPYPRDPRHLVQFFARGGGSGQVAGAMGRDPAGWLRVEQSGLVAIGYASRPTQIELAGPDFDRYLEEQGLEHVLARRKAGPSWAGPVREAFSRCAKTLLHAGEAGPGSAHAEPLGLALELLPEVDPAVLEPGDVLPVRLVWHGAPLGGARISVFSNGDADRRAVARTDAEGRALVRLDRAGLWMLSVVHMREAREDTAIDWSSTWSSLTFDVGRPRRAEDTTS